MTDVKPRSRDVTDGLERTAARGMLRAVGMRRGRLVRLEYVQMPRLHTSHEAYDRFVVAQNDDDAKPLDTVTEAARKKRAAEAGRKLEKKGL